jgi:hypothetical protein
MSAADTMTFDTPPAFGPIYRKVLFGKKRPGLRAGATLPQLAAECKGVRIDAANLALYRSVCHIEGGAAVPLLYPHVLTGSLHLAIMTHEAFPLSMMGAVHLRNHVLGRRVLDPAEPFDIHCSLDAHRPAKAGVELDVSTTLTDASGARAWESISTYLVRGKFGEAVELPARVNIAEVEPTAEVAAWFVPSGTGRKYARVCGDWNPIHISTITAKLFGFKSEIVHGMWAAAVCLGKLPEAGGAEQCDLLFKGPTFMRSKVRLLRADADGGSRFDLFCGSNPKPSIAAWRRPVNASAKLVG